MTNEELLAKAYMDSGCIEPAADGGLACRVCGARTMWDDVLKLEHADGCALKRTVDGFSSLMHAEATMGATEIPDAVKMQFETSLPPYKLAAIDRLVDGVCSSGDIAEALLGVEAIMKDCPYANRDFLTVFASGMYRSPEQRQALRDYLVFEFAVADKERKLREQLESAKREVALIAAQLARTQLPEHVTKRLI